MKDNELKSYDIASFDIELEYNKKIAPLQRKIEKLNSNHESKSLSAHKDFLAKEKKSKDKLNEQNDKSVIKNQKIERAVENKIKKLSIKDNRYHKEYDSFVDEKDAFAISEFQKIDEVTNQLQSEELNDKSEIEQKYKTNIESYVEKLDIYNNNFENNKNFHVKEIKRYQTILNSNIQDLEEFHSNVNQEIDRKLNDFMIAKGNSDNEITRSKAEASQMLNSLDTKIRKEANLVISDVKNYVNDLQNEYQEHYEPILSKLNDELVSLKDSFEVRRELIEKDLEINLKKLESQLETVKESRNRKAKKNIMMKIELFNLRATTTIKYEERLLNEKIKLLQKEQEFVSDKHEFEKHNLSKLEVFLLNDELELKNTGDYFKDLNIVLKTELNNFEYANNNYLLKHEQLKTDFIKNYTKIFKDLKECTVKLAQAYLEKIADNNFAIDDINKFLDTAEPLKEIKVNRLREDIEVSEVKERFKIKYAKQNYEAKIIQNTLDTEKTIEEFRMKELLSENQKEISEIRNKEVYDKSLEKAKLKHTKAQEVYNLRLNNTKLERNLLKNKFDTEIDILGHNKTLAEINVRKHNALRSKELEYSIKNHQMEANYKIEVINKGLEEDLLRLEEKVNKVKFEKDAYSSNMQLATDKKQQEIIARKEEINEQTAQKVALIEQALDRELKEPSRNMLKTETIIDERLAKLDINNAIFVDFINDSTSDYRDNKLSLEQIREVILKNEIVYEKSEKYIGRLYAVLTEAVKFMNDIEKHALLNKIAATSEQSTVKKLKKQLAKQETENFKQSNAIKTSENDHKVLIKNFIVEQLTKIQKANPENINALVHITEESYNSIFNHLQELQENVKRETTKLYSSLTSNDKELIDYANLNAEKSKAKVLEEKLELFKPIDDELQLFLDMQKEEYDKFVAHFDDELNEYRANINQHKNEALEKVKIINNDKNELISTIKARKIDIEETEEKEIVKRYEEIDQAIKNLEDNYNDTLNNLSKKDEEAKKIFDYEDRIYNIAVESATARFNDANTKTKNIHLNNLKNYRQGKDKAIKDKEKNLSLYNKELLELTRSFEKNIFTVRPRLEESIGDAQKEIDKEIKENEEMLNGLVENNQKLILSAENSLFAAFNEGYDRLHDNLQNYVEKYRLIEAEYLQKNTDSNNVIDNNNNAFSNALFELNKKKHSKTLIEITSINESISKEEVL